jgi:hypothetical protein
MITPWHRHYMIVTGAQPYTPRAGMGNPFGNPLPSTVVLRHCRCSHVDTVVLAGDWDLDTVRGWGSPPAVYTEAPQVGTVAVDPVEAAALRDPVVREAVANAKAGDPSELTRRPRMRSSGS